MARRGAREMIEEFVTVLLAQRLKQGGSVGQERLPSAHDLA
jgi:hypothetical protein